MGKILIFNDIVENILARQRDVTIFGEENLLSRKKGCDKDYDLYFFCADGIVCNNINLPEYKQIPVFSNPEMQKLRDFHEEYNNEMLGFYSIGKNDRKKDKTPSLKLLLCSYDSLHACKGNLRTAEVKGKADFLTIERKELFQKLKKVGFEHLEEDLNNKCEYIKYII